MERSPSHVDRTPGGQAAQDCEWSVCRLAGPISAFLDSPIETSSRYIPYILLGHLFTIVIGVNSLVMELVSKVHVHPSYNSSDFRADLAILMLSSPVEFTMYVRPVCLWSPSFTELKVVEGKDGTIVTLIKRHHKDDKVREDTSTEAAIVTPILSAGSVPKEQP
uniref:Peptidase S1 domain-containing protein n=1 Tax=Timema poppense TaxID=170557 RepID=A0A7R9H8I6_TIMPO|nr:unnamed protein product [Timema poppensis]